MIKKHLLKSLFLLCALIVGSSAWAEDVTYDFTNIDGFSSWGTSYSEHVVEYDEATVTFSSANRQTGTITNQPVTKGQPVTIVMKDDNTLSSVSFTCTQWGTKAQTITLHYSTDGGENYTSTGITSTNFTITNNNLPSGTNAVKITFSSTSNQVGIASAEITMKNSSAPTTYTVTYNGNSNTSGNVPEDDKEYESGDEVTVLGNTGNLAKSGYTFGGWNTLANGEGTNYFGGNTFEITDDITLYAKWNAKTITGLSYTGTPTKTEYVSGENFDPKGLTVTATFDDSSEEDVTTSVTWTPSPLTVGTTSVTGTYMGQTINVTGLTVTAAPGSAELPYTIAQAKAAIDAGTGITGVYVHGIISQVDSYNSTYNSITYWISDDGTTTNQFEVYGGFKSENNESGSFNSKDDLEVGDVVTVYGNIMKFNSTYEFDKNNYLTSFVRKTASDLAITSSTPVALEITTAELNPTSTITWTTSSTGAMSFVSNATGVATVSNAGVITAVGAGEATITITQAADEEHKASTEKTVTVNVTDNRSACATGIDLTSAKTILKEATDDLAATSTKADGFTGSITYSYVSADPDIFYIDGTEYMGAGVGATTVTITATPTGGNAANYKPASQEVAVTVNGTNSISLDPTSKTVAFSASTFTITATVPTENYNGTVSAVSDNENVATVSVDGSAVTVTPVAVGTARITVTAGTGTYYLATAQANCNVEFTAPAGSTTANEDKVVTTTFTNKDLEYSEGGIDWTASIGANSFESSGSARGVQFGAAKGEFTLTATGKNVKKVSMVLSTNGTDNTIEVSVGSNTFTTTYGVEEGDDPISELTLTSGMSKETVEFTGDAGDAVTISVNDANKSVYFQSITLYEEADPVTAKLNASGYATFCSQYPLDFSDYATAEYSAWQITDVSGETITFSQITGKVKGGTGILLKGEAGATVTLASADSDTELAENKLFGTLAPTYVAANEYYGLSGNKFVKVNAGTVPAGKALLPATEVSGARELTFVFDGETTGISTMHNSQCLMHNEVFDLQGRKVAQPSKGLYIMNGKKVVIK